MDLRVAAYAVITDERGRVLLAHWNQYGHSAWTMPGGGIDPGEDPEHAAVREVREETGHDVVLEGLLGIDSRVVPREDRLSDTTAALHTLRILYRARIVGGALRDETDGSTDRADWFAVEEIAALDRVSLVEVALGFAGIPL